MVKQRLVLLLLSIWDTYYMHDRYVLGEGASYPIDGAEFPDAKGGENGTYTAMLDTGIAVSSISRVQFITVSNPIDLWVVLNKILFLCQGGSAYRNVAKHTKKPEWPSTVNTF
jgi:hypothetical protein